MASLSILHIVHQFLPHHRHGVEHSTLELAQEQVRRGHKVAILAGEFGHFRHEVDVVEEQVRELPVFRMYFNPRSENGFLHHAGFAEAFQRLLVKLMPDVIHIQHLNHLSLDIIHVARSMDIPLVYTLRDFASFCARVNLVRGDGSLCRGSDLVEDCRACLAQSLPLSSADRFEAGWIALRRNIPNPRSWRLLLERLLAGMHSIQPPLKLAGPADFVRRNEAMIEAFESVDAILSISRDVAVRTHSFLSPSLDIKPIHQAPDVRRIRHRERHPGGSGVRFGYIGKFTRIKGVHVLLEAFRRLPVGAAELHLKGAPTWTDLWEIAYYRQMRRLGDRPDIHFYTAPTPRERISEFYHRIDVLVVPSIWFEAFGRVVVEALAAGVPVICSNEGGVAELVRDGVDGLHVRIGDPEDLALVLRRLVQQPETVNRMSRNCRVPKDVDTYNDDVENIYRQVIEARQGTTGISGGGDNGQ